MSDLESEAIARIAHRIVCDMKHRAYGTSEAGNKGADCTWADVRLAIMRGINLVNVPHTQVLNIARDEDGKFWGFLHDSRAAADRNAGTHRISCIPVTFTEGEGLERRS